MNKSIVNQVIHYMHYQANKTESIVSLPHRKFDILYYVFLY